MAKRERNKFEKNNPYANLPKLSAGADLKNVRKLTRIEFEGIILKYFRMPWSKIEESMADPEKRKNIPIIEYMVLSVMNKAITEGDAKRLDFLLDRTLGQIVMKKKQEVEEIEGDGLAPVPLSAAEKLEMLDKMRRKIENDSSEPPSDTIVDVTPEEPDSE